jgi:hypothetical protein
MLAHVPGPKDSGAVVEIEFTLVLKGLQNLSWLSSLVRCKRFSELFRVLKSKRLLVSPACFCETERHVHTQSSLRFETLPSL